MRAVGCLLVVLLLAAIGGEIWLAIYIGSHIEDYGGVLTSLITLAVLTVIGVRLVKWRMQRMPQAMLSGRAGRGMAGVFGAVLIAVPGFVTGALGLLLQLPPVQALFAGVMQKLLARLMKVAMQRMGGGAGGMPGGFPGGMPGGFPGGMGGGGAPGAAGGFDPQQMQKAMQMFQAMQAKGGAPGGGKGPKTYDVQAQRGKLKGK